jgi:hypothetical protein
LQTWQGHDQPHEYFLTDQNMHLHGEFAIFINTNSRHDHMCHFLFHLSLSLSLSGRP